MSLAPQTHKEETVKLSSLRFHDQDEIEGTSVAVDRDKERREQRLRTAMASQWPEIARSRLEHGRHLITDTATGELFSVVRGEIDGRYSPVAAYFVDEHGQAIFLERPAGGPRNRDELAARRQAKEQAAAERRKPRVRS